ncbi:MAG: YbbR-like domain-containing protein [Bacteroidales bacterium]|nr:YbbR-like domain-containing protein [Bacteroidales bacterium]
MKSFSFHTIWLTIKKYFALLLDIQSLFHQKVVTFLFFVFLSAIFWFFRALSQEYEDEILYPVRYINIPENKVIMNALPEKLALKVKARGRKILFSKLNLNLIPIKFDVNSFVTKDTKPDSLFILTNSVKDILSKELEGVEIMSISPDTLFFNFTTMGIKKVIVKTKYRNKPNMFATQYMINGPVIVEPDSIIISGPGQLLQDIQSIYTESMDIINLNDTITMSVGLEKQEGISYSQKKVRVTIPVDKYTQADYYLPVTTVNLPDSLTIKTFPERIRISYNVTLTNYDKINPSGITPHVDYNEAVKNPSARLRLFLVDTPDIITAVKFSPEKVEYLLTRK